MTKLLLSKGVRVERRGEIPGCVIKLRWGNKISEFAANCNLIAIRTETAQWDCTRPQLLLFFTSLKEVLESTSFLLSLGLLSPPQVVPLDN